MNKMLLYGLFIWGASFVIVGVLPPDHLTLFLFGGVMRLIGFAMTILGIIRIFTQKKR